jgi:hypothetical protein
LPRHEQRQEVVRQKAMSTTQLTPVEPGNRIQLPVDWTDALGLHGFVALERTSDGILIRPHPSMTWNDIFATKLTIGSAPPDENVEAVEVTEDDFLF